MSERRINLPLNKSIVFIVKQCWQFKKVNYIFSMCNYFCVFKYILFVHDRHFTHVQCKIDFSMSLECFYSFIFIFHLSYTKYLYDNFCITKNIFSSRLGQGALYTTTWTSLCTQLHMMIDIYSHLENTCMGAFFLPKGEKFGTEKLA